MLDRFPGDLCIPGGGLRKPCFSGDTGLEICSGCATGSSSSRFLNRSSEYSDPLSSTDLWSTSGTFFGEVCELIVCVSKAGDRGSAPNAFFGFGANVGD
ncbi:hypothetical protein OGAPHI_006656 [Ogataea philodendri]|uniref:Uncharacterized protein n=1 Tax=Ogataea philodendri TaxID=1378263 RepID=A0A9P8T0J8_9ASCO|nr:uncharacterized protein OGAPHI_006656 [Ogataea philodendri]KAH3661249.1 hypothetical protein OGAPHI_006656 [Ogataea philodendri]